MRSGANNESVGSHNYPIIHFGCSLVQSSGAVKKGQTIRNLKLLQYLPIYVKMIEESQSPLFLSYASSLAVEA